MKTTQLYIKVILCASMLIIIGTKNLSFSQIIKCATVEMDSIRHAQNPNLQSNEDFESDLQKLILAKKKQAETQLIIGGVYQIPVVVHVIHNGEAVGTGTNVSFAAIQSQIDVLNEDFRRMLGSNGYNTHPDGADTQIEFCLAMRRPDGSAFPVGEPGVNRINRSTAGFSTPPYSTTYIDATIKPWTYNNGNPTATRGWTPDKYMNLWLCNISGSVLGYAQFPTSIIGGQSCGTQSDATDGVVFLYNSIGKSSVTGFTGQYNEGRTATHEIGHWLGLRHIWGDSNCGEDYCNDTPKSTTMNFNCPTQTTCDGIQDMVQNYMDYTDDLCMNIFTNDQKMRMRTVLENSPIRVSLITSDACVPPNTNDASIVNIINPKGDNCAGSITPTVVLRNRGSANLTSATISYTIDGGIATNFSWTGTITPGNQANVVLPAFTAPLGIHVFNAVSSLPNGVADPSTTYDASEITFAVSNGYQPNYSQNFDGGVFPPNVRWNVVNPNSDCYEWIGAAAVSSTGVSNNACALMPNYGNGTTQDEYMYTPIYILPCNASAANLIFDVAYRRRNTTTNDQLRVEISTDCGATWNATPIYNKSGATLHTNTTASNTYWIPSAASDWRNESISLLSFVGTTSKSVQFRFRATCGNNGGNLYVDNMKFTATTPAEVNVQVAGADILDGGFYNAGNFTIGSPTTLTFTVQNTGNSTLTLTPPISVTGASQFVLGSSFGSTSVTAGGSTTFTITFTPTGAGPFTANISFGTNDCDEGTYNFVINGGGLVSPPVAGFTGTPTTICQGASVTFTDASTSATSWSWTFTGGTPSTATGAGPHVITYATAGTYNVSLTATNSYGSNVSTQNNYVTVNGGTVATLPLVEGFTATTFPPTNWSITNGGSGVTWIRSTTQGTAPTAGKSAVINNYSTDFTGAQDDLNAVPVNLSSFASAQLTFDVAYAYYNATHVDQLDVLVSTDCGATFNVVYSKSGLTLATNGTQTTAYTAPTTWRNETVDLTPYIGNSSVQVKFRNISGYGQYLYLDNINITGVTATATANYTVNPNPACVNSTVTFTDASTNASSWSWNFGTGATPATATGVGPHSVIYSSAGTKNISLSINGGASISNQSIVVNAIQSAAFTYASGTYCTAGSDPTPTITGVTGGTFTSSPAGLSMNATTGVIDLSASSAATYTVTYTTAGPCPGTATFGVIVKATPSAPVVTITNNCGNSTLTTSGTGLLWSTGATMPSINVTSAGTITVTQTVAGCTSTAGSGVANPIAVPSTPVVTVTNNCGNSTLTTSGTGLLWSTGATTPSINVTSAGTIIVTQTVAGCTSTAGSGVANPTAVPSTPVVTVTNNCGNSTLTTSGTGLLWSTGATTPSINVASAGTITVTQTVAGCISSAGSGVANPTAVPAITLASFSNPSACGVQNGLLTIGGSGTGIVSWTGASSGNSGTISLPYTITGLGAGAYSVVFNTACPSNTIATNLSDPSGPAAPTVTVTNTCGSSTLTATGSNLTWSTGQTTASIVVNTSGTYTVTQSVSGCSSGAGSGVANPTAIPSAPIVSVTNNCGNSVLTTSGSNLLWSTGESTSTITVVTSGTYTVTQTIAGCTSAIGSGIANTTAGPSAPIVTVSDNCSSSTLTTTGTNLLWSTGETTSSIVVTVPGTYTVTQTVGGCTSASGSGIANPGTTLGAPVVTVTNNCGSSTLTSTGTNLLWSNGETTSAITVLVGGTYTVIETVSGCQSAPGSGVANPGTLPLAPLVTVIDNCGTSVLSATGSSIFWSTSEAGTTISVNTAGTYYATQTVNGCTSPTASIVANPKPLPSVAQTPLLTVCSYAPIFTLSGGSPAGGTYSGTGVTANQFNPAVSGPGSWIVTYTFTAANGCSNSAMQTQYVDPCAKLDEVKSIEIGIVPNPTFGVVTVSATSTLKSVKLYDYTGRLVMDKNGTNESEIIVDLSNLSNGVYTFLVAVENETFTKRIVLHK